MLRAHIGDHHLKFRFHTENASIFVGKPSFNNFKIAGALAQTFPRGSFGKCAGFQRGYCVQAVQKEYTRTTKAILNEFTKNPNHNLAITLLKTARKENSSSLSSLYIHVVNRIKPDYRIYRPLLFAFRRDPVKTLYFWEEMKHYSVFPDQTGFELLIWACINANNLTTGTELFQLLVAKNSDLRITLKIFNLFMKIFRRDANPGNLISLISLSEEQLVVLDDPTYLTLLKIAATSRWMDLGKRVYYHLVDRQGLDNLSVKCAAALIATYGKCGELDEASTLFNQLPPKLRNVVTWNTMISSFGDSGNLEKALELLEEMQQQQFEPDIITWTALIAAHGSRGLIKQATELFRRLKASTTPPDAIAYAAMISACTTAYSLDQGREIHAEIVRSGCKISIDLQNTLIGMYSKCGSLHEAMELFEANPAGRDVVTWNTIINAYALNGLAPQAFQKFDLMVKELLPNRGTFLGLLSACKICRLGMEALHYLQLMSKRYKLTPDIDHYALAVNAVAKSGNLFLAKKIVQSMSRPPNFAIWKSLLESSILHKNEEVARYAAEKALTKYSQSPELYVLWANFLKSIGSTAEAAIVLSTMEKKADKRVRATHAYINVNGNYYALSSKDNSFPEYEATYNKAKSLLQEVQQLGVTIDTEGNIHCELLAVALGLLKTAGKIMVASSSQMCGDCHEAMKSIAQISNREICIRDTNRFHEFKDGKCSCFD